MEDNQQPSILDTETTSERKKFSNKSGEEKGSTAVRRTV